MKANSQNISAYKAAYKKHRRRPLDPKYIGDLEELIDFCQPSKDPRIFEIKEISSDNERVNDIDSSANDDISSYKYSGPRFGLTSHPGFVYIPQALGKDVQMDLAYQALTEYLQPPHTTNIDLLPIKENEIDNGTMSMWDLWKKSLNLDDQDDDEGYYDKSSKKNTPKKRRKETEINSNKSKPQFYKSFDKLSWATTGYHYDWAARAYVEERKSPMPKHLLKLGSIFANLDPSMACPQSCAEKETGADASASESICGAKPNTFNSSASIINYYTLKSNMGGHRDDLELDFTKPVVSISLGLPAVFLLGSKTKDDPVVPVLVRPGDVCLLAGESRLSYHGMARVIPAEVSLPMVGPKLGGIEVNDFQIQSLESVSSNEFKSVNETKSEIKPLEMFLSTHRININLRQVLPDGMERIPKVQ